MPVRRGVLSGHDCMRGDGPAARVGNAALKAVAPITPSASRRDMFMTRLRRCSTEIPLLWITENPTTKRSSHHEDTKEHEVARREEKKVRLGIYPGSRSIVGSHCDAVQMIN